MAGIRVVDVRHTGGAQRSTDILAELDAGIQRRHIVVVVNIAEVAVELRGWIDVHAQHVVAARMRRAGGFRIIHNVGLRAWPGGEIGEREEIEHRLTQRGDPVGRDDVARKCRAVGRIDDGGQRTVVLETLGEITRPLERGRRILVLHAAGHELSGILLRPEEEQLVLVLVEVSRDVHRSADGIRLDVETIGRNV